MQDLLLVCGKGAGAGQCIWANEFEIGVLSNKLDLALLIVDMQEGVYTIYYRVTSHTFFQCFGSGSVWIRFTLVSRIRFNETDRIREAKNQPKSWKIFSKKLIFCLDINIYLINNKTNHFLEKYNF